MLFLFIILFHCRETLFEGAMRVHARATVLKLYRHLIGMFSVCLVTG